MSSKIHQDLILAIKLVYDPCNFNSSEPKAEAESQEYGAATFMINSNTVKFRAAKLTPRKIGQFVTIWKRSGPAPIEPFHITDELDLIIISLRDGSNYGQFIFPKAVLFSKGIISGPDKQGKRGIRVYPPWVKTLNPQATRTQKWQLDYFLDLTGDKTDLDRAKKLLESQESKS